MTRLMTLMALMSLTACDIAERHDRQRERGSGQYQEAMADYKAGRLTQAVEGFRKACRADPANASARFQLACLLQDSVRDYFGAFCAYQEFLFLQPDGDKSKLAKDRAAICEREAAKVLAEKHGLTNESAISRELEETRKCLKDAEKRNAKLNDDVSVVMQRVAHLLEENAKLKAAIKGDAGDVGSMVSAGVKDAKALLDEDDSDRMQISDEALRLKREEGESDGDRVKQSADIAALRHEADADEDLATAPMLPSHDKVPAVKEKKAPESQRPAEPPHEKRPAEYVIQEGDTLYKIAMRFYGRSSAWKIIRDANKAAISVDGRVKSGMKIRLPDPR